MSISQKRKAEDLFQAEGNQRHLRTKSHACSWVGPSAWRGAAKRNIRGTIGEMFITWSDSMATECPVLVIVVQIHKTMLGMSVHPWCGDYFVPGLTDWIFSSSGSLPQPWYVTPLVRPRSLHTRCPSSYLLEQVLRQQHLALLNPDVSWGRKNNPEPWN